MSTAENKDVCNLKNGNQPFLKTLVTSYYDLQKLRIQMGNRICAQFKSRLQIDLKEKEPEIDSPDASKEEREAMKMIKQIRDEWKLLAEGFVNEAGFLKPKLQPSGIFHSKTEIIMVKQYMDMLRQEEEFTNTFKPILEEFPVYNTFLKDVVGCGELIAATILATLDPYKAVYPSGFIAFAGLDTVMVQRDGALVCEGRSRRKEHLVEREYTTKDGETAKRVGITFHPMLKTKLVGVMMGTVLKAVRYPPEIKVQIAAAKTTAEKQAIKDAVPISIKYGHNKYARVYFDYRNRLEHVRRHEGKTDMHKFRMAARYAMKQFLIDLHKAWRTAEGLPLNLSYAEGKLGIFHNEGKKAA